MSDITALARRLLAAATPGPWAAYYTTHGEGFVTLPDLPFTDGIAAISTSHHDHHGGRDDYGRADTEFIAAAPTLVAGLLAENKALTALPEPGLLADLAARLRQACEANEYPPMTADHGAAVWWLERIATIPEDDMALANRLHADAVHHGNFAEQAGGLVGDVYRQRAADAYAAAGAVERDAAHRAEIARLRARFPGMAAEADASAQQMADADDLQAQADAAHYDWQGGRDD